MLHSGGGKTCYLVDGSQGTGDMGRLYSEHGPEDPPNTLAEDDSSKLRATYLTLLKHGYTLKGIVVTNTDANHFKGIQKLVDNGIQCPILVTDCLLGKAKDINNGSSAKAFLESLEKKRYSGKHVIMSNLSSIHDIFPPDIFSFQCLFSYLVLYRHQAHTGTMRRLLNKKDYSNPHLDNLMGIIVTITNPHTKKPLALLTGDADYKMQTQNEWKHIPLVLVPHHGSKNCSDSAFYKSCTAHTYLISCGSH